jgi:hypothetical protein
MSDCWNEEQDREWCEQRRKQVADYLKGQGLRHGEIGECPAWHVAPYVSIWAVESVRSLGWVGWWVICGDLPTDYVSADAVKHPREAMRVIADAWLDMAVKAEAGEPAGDDHLPGIETNAELLPLLKSRARILHGWAEDDSMWAEDV